MNTYYDTSISDSVRLAGGTSVKRYRIRKHNEVPYITYKRRTRVLFKNLVGGAYINVNGSRIYFL
jgi:hypothetical protein